MGIRDCISSTTDYIKRNAPDSTSVKGVYWSSYDFIKRNAPEIATNSAKKTAIIAIREGAKSIPGGLTVYDIVIRSIPREKKAKECKDVKEIKDEVRQMETEQDRMKHELNDCKRLLEQQEVDRQILEFKTNKILGLNRKPEDVNRFFEFTGKQYLDDVIAPVVKPK